MLQRFRAFLIIIAKGLKGAVKRPGDMIARFGGEEFVAVLPETETEGAREIAKSIQGAVNALSLPHEFSPVSDHVTVSVGGHSGVPVPASTPRELIGKADEMLYAAKQAGRNRVMIGPRQGL